MTSILPSTNTHVPDLINLRRVASHGFVGVMWTMIVVNGLSCGISGMSVAIASGVALVSAIIGTITVLANPVSLFTRLVVAVCLMNQYDAFIYATSFTPYQLDAHMLYFVLAALLLTYFCWATLLAACIHTAIQHFSFNILIPFYLYPNGTDWLRFLYHATILITQLVGTGYLAIRVHQMFSDGYRMLADVETASTEAASLRTRQDAERTAVEGKARDVLVQLADDFERHMSTVVKHVASAATEMDATSHSMLAVSEETKRRAAAATAAAAQASHNVQTVATAAKQLDASIVEIGHQVARASATTSSAVDQAHRTDGIVRSLADAAQKIGEVVNLIKAIASQTNLLALNATIEAARAGEAGRGFAVVATEVKTLASQTAHATEDIASQISAVQAATNEAVKAIRDITETVGQISQVSAAIAGAVEQQRASTRDITFNVEQAADGTSAVANNVAAVTEAAAEASRAASLVLSEAAGLSKTSEELNSEAFKFIARVRAG